MAVRPNLVDARLLSPFHFDLCRHLQSSLATLEKDLVWDVVYSVILNSLKVQSVNCDRHRNQTHKDLLLKKNKNIIL